MIEIQAHGYLYESTQWELSNEYQHEMLRWFSRIIAAVCME